MAEIIIHGIIGDSDSGCDAVSVLEQLRRYRTQAVDMTIESPGGSFYEGLTIYNAIQQRTAPTVARLGTMCGSAATVIACGCPRVIMPKNGTFFVHKTLTATAGHAREHRDAVNWLDHCDGLLMQVYTSKTGQDAKTIERLIEGLGDGTAMNADDALRYGFVDEITQAAGRKTSAEMQSAIVNRLHEHQAARIKAKMQDLQSRQLRESMLRHRVNAALKQSGRAR